MTDPFDKYLGKVMHMCHDDRVNDKLEQFNGHASARVADAITYGLDEQYDAHLHVLVVTTIELRMRGQLA